MFLDKVPELLPEEAWINVTVPFHPKAKYLSLFICQAFLKQPTSEIGRDEYREADMNTSTNVIG